MKKEETQLKLTAKQQLLLQFAQLAHDGQTRKYTGEPYIAHPLTVGMTAQAYSIPFGFEIGILHDVVEDCPEWSIDKVLAQLVSCGYDKRDAIKIATHVLELTDEYTKKDYPLLNRDQRKSMESVRLASVSSVAQSIKAIDIIDNTRSIVAQDPGFAEVYLAEVHTLLELMEDAASSLRSYALKLVTNHITSNEFKKSIRAKS